MKTAFTSPLPIPAGEKRYGENSVETVENKRFFHLCPRMWKLVESFAGRLSQTPAVRGITGASVRNGAAGMPFVPNRETGP